MLKIKTLAVLGAALALPLLSNSCLAQDKMAPKMGGKMSDSKMGGKMPMTPKMTKMEMAMAPKMTGKMAGAKIVSAMTMNTKTGHTVVYNIRMKNGKMTKVMKSMPGRAMDHKMMGGGKMAPKMDGKMSGKM